MVNTKDSGEALALQVQVARTLEEAKQLSERWSTLADSVGARHYVQPYWCLPWWEHRSRGELYIAFVERDGRLVALAPLYLQKSLGVRVLRFLGSEFSQVSEILVAPGDVEAGARLWDHLTSDKMTFLSLRGFRAGSVGLEMLRIVRDRGWTAQLDTACPIVNTSGSWEEYLQGRSQALKRKLRRAERFIERDCLTTRVEVVGDPGTLDTKWKDIVSVFDIAEESNPRLNFFGDPFIGFTTQMLNEFASCSRLNLYILYIGNGPAAVAMTYRSGSTMCYGSPRYDPSYSVYSPGHLVLQAILHDAFEGETKEVDLLWGNTPYKQEWATGKYEALSVSVARSRKAQLFQVLAEQVAGSPKAARVARRMATFGGLESGARRRLAMPKL